MVDTGAEGVHYSDLGLETGQTSDPENLTSSGLDWIVGIAMDRPWLSLGLVLRDGGRLQWLWRTGAYFHGLSEYCRWNGGYHLLPYQHSNSKQDAPEK